MTPRLKAPLVFLLSLAVGALLLQALQPNREDPKLDPGAQASRDPQPGHVYTGVAEEPDSLNPFTTTSAVARRYVLAFTHDTLLDVDPISGASRNALAERAEVHADGMGMDVTIRDGVTFSDGAQLSIDDVLWTFECARGEGVVLGSLASGMAQCSGAERIEGAPRSLRIRFATPHFAAMRTVGESWVVTQKAWMQRAIADAAARDGTPIPTPRDPSFGAMLARVTHSPGPGTGPYRLLDDASGRPGWRRGVDLTVVQNETSWRRGDPSLWSFAAIRVRFLSDAALRFAALKKRELDWCTGADLAAQLRADAGLANDYQRLVYDMPTLGAYVVQWNVRKEPLKDARVRRALGMLFDRRGIADTIFGGAASPAAAFLKPQSDGMPDGLAPLPFDIDAARALLVDANVAHADAPMPLQLLVPVEAPWFRRMGELMASAGQKAGVAVELIALPFAELVRRRDSGLFDGAMLLVSMPAFGDPYELFHSGGARNAGGFADAEVDAFLATQRTERDPKARASLLQRAHLRLAELQPCALIVHPLAEVLVDARLLGAAPGPLGLWPERMSMPPAFWRR